MKRPALILFVIFLVALISIYFIIPEKLEMKSETHIDATDMDVFRFIIQKKNWAKWWPGQYSKTDTTFFTYKGTTYLLKKNTNSQIQVLIKGKNELSSEITYLATGDGSTRVSWYAQMRSSINPLKRINDLIEIKKTGKQMNEILTQFKKFMQTDTNLYGIKVNLNKVKNPVMLAASRISAVYPSPAFVYGMITGLKQQIIKQNALQTDYPMLNINQTDEKEYQVMVALPVNKTITPGDGMVINRMLLGGNILETTVKGGRYTVENAFIQLKKYQKDHGLISPAMPFELLVTDRLAELDTAKWVTKIFYPIF